MVKPGLSGITAVRYSGSLIEVATARLRDQDGTSAQLSLTRDALMERIRTSGPMLTLHQQPDGQWVAWDKIQLLEIDGAEFLKCIIDGDACDDLGDVPLEE
ncbi:MAG: hypothetical protein Q7T13_17270 [Polaromonas sp.]|nr:hypothetical protein [Polaromonas sp.]